MGYKKGKAPFPLAFLKARLHYDPYTGFWRRLDRPNTPAGHTMKQGYRRMRIGGKRYLAHVLAWFYMTGRWPHKIVDHRDNDPANGRWKNLRLATWVQNRVNSKCRADNQTKMKGVIRRGKNCFEAMITVRKKRISLGHYRKPTLAHRAYCAAAQKHFGEYARAA